MAQQMDVPDGLCGDPVCAFVHKFQGVVSAGWCLRGYGWAQFSDVHGAWLPTNSHLA